LWLVGCKLVGAEGAGQLNHAVAISMVEGPAAGLALLRRLENDTRINNDADHRFALTSRDAG